MHPPEPRPRGGWFFFGVFVISVVATALVVAQGLMYGLHDLPTLARDAGFASFAAWLLPAFWSLFASVERGAAKPGRARAAQASSWCVGPAPLRRAPSRVHSGH